MELDRRAFLKAGSGILAATALPEWTSAQTETSTGRLVLPMNRNWRFHPAPVDGAEKPAFDDTHFQTVVLPHTNVRLPWHNFDDKDYEFVSTYRRRFTLPPQARGKRVFVDFEGAMTASGVWINGTSLGEYKGGFTPFSFDLTPHLHLDRPNVLTVRVDSTERADIPPFGHEIDYLTFGGIYREVSLRIVPDTYLDNLFVRTQNVLTPTPHAEVDCFLAGAGGEGYSLALQLLEGKNVLAQATHDIARFPAEDPDASADPVMPGAVHASSQTVHDARRHTVALPPTAGIKLWALDAPQLYTVRVQLLRHGHVIDQDTRRIGFRTASFTDHGFELNGVVVKLRGLDRHQTFPFVGQAMPARVQRQDAHILRHELHCNIVRTSHYPQSRHFLDACDEMGLLVLEEIPGWQHIGDEPWKQISIDNVGRMIRRDWNHPSIILWGVRINESKDDHDFYTRTNALAHLLDPTRQTGGIRYFQDSEFLEDVFTMNDFGFPLKKPNHPRYLNTEFVGHTFPTKTTDDDERQREHTLRHARIHDQLASDPQYAGGIGWCAFDYNTHANFGSGDRICYHGVTDIFRTPKAAAGFYKSQCDPAEEVVLEPAFHWANGDESTRFLKMLFCSNCETLQVYQRPTNAPKDDWVLLSEVQRDRAQFPHLKYAPFLLDRSQAAHEGSAGRWGDLQIEGYIGGKKVITKRLSGRGADAAFVAKADDRELRADGADTTRVVLRVTDEFGATRTYANDPIAFHLEGPAELIGDNPFALIGGTGAVWIRTRELPGAIRLTCKHPRLGTQVVAITSTRVAPERV